MYVCVCVCVCVSQVYVPQPIQELSSQRVMTSEWVHGVAIDKVRHVTHTHTHTRAHTHVYCCLATCTPRHARRHARLGIQGLLAVIEVQ